MSNWSYTSGDWWINCDVCNKKIKASTSKHRWDGMIVCHEDYEERHIQEFLRVSPDKITVPFIRHPEDTFLFTCDVWSKHPNADYGKADCMQAGYAFYSPAELVSEFPVLP